jgi:hypothetical protein
MSHIGTTEHFWKPAVDEGNRSRLILIDGNRNPPNVMLTIHVPLMNSGYICAAGGMLKTEFFNKAGSFFASLLAKPLEVKDGVLVAVAALPPAAAATAESGRLDVEKAAAMNPIASLRPVCDQPVTWQNPWHSRHNAKHRGAFIMGIKVRRTHHQKLISCRGQSLHVEGALGWHLLQVNQRQKCRTGQLCVASKQAKFLLLLCACNVKNRKKEPQKETRGQNV